MNIIDFFDPADFKDTIVCAALGARVCYNKGDLDSLLAEERVTDPAQRAKFLQKLAKSKHYSIFSHAFAYKDIGEAAAREFAATRFKTRYNPADPGVLGVSLRHYLEELLDKHPGKIGEVFDEIATLDAPVKVLDQEDNVALVGLIKGYRGHAVFYIDNVSRTLTHQLVRHTILDFSQRSQRYVSETSNSIIVPESIRQNPLALGIFNRATTHAQEAYGDLLKDGIRKEDARFLLPHGAKTTIMVSGSLDGMQEFIRKRNHSKVQWEVRKVAQNMQYLLDNSLAR